MGRKSHRKFDNVKTKTELEHIKFMLKWLNPKKDEEKIKRYKERLKKYENIQSKSNF